MGFAPPWIAPPMDWTVFASVAVVEVTIFGICPVAFEGCVEWIVCGSTRATNNKLSDVELLFFGLLKNM